MSSKGVFIIGYSGHALVVLDIFALNNINVIGYCDSEEKKDNPFSIPYLGNEQQVDSTLATANVNAFIAIGNNTIRIKVANVLKSKGFAFTNAIHPKAAISAYAKLDTGILVAANASINSMAVVGEGVVCNTCSVIEHECIIGKYTHIAPGAVLCGNVTVGNNCFIGANAVIKQGITIGNNVTIGAGTTVISSIEENSTVVGNPQRIIKE